MPATRPPKRGPVVSSRWVSVRLTPEEWQRVAVAAQSAGLSVSDFARRALLGKP